MAKLLRPYGVSSVDVKIDGVNQKGYRRTICTTRGAATCRLRTGSHAFRYLGY